MNRQQIDQQTADQQLHEILWWEQERDIDFDLLAWRKKHSRTYNIPEDYITMRLHRLIKQGRIEKYIEREGRDRKVCYVVADPFEIGAAWGICAEEKSHRVRNDK